MITKDNSTQSDGCVRFVAHHSGTPVAQSAGAVLRWSAPDSYVVALVQDNSSNGQFNSVWIYQYPGVIGLNGTLTNQVFGTSPAVEACIVGTTVTVRVDANQDGTYETTTSNVTPVAVTSPGLSGTMTWAQSGTISDMARIDDYCWGP